MDPQRRAIRRNRLVMALLAMQGQTEIAVRGTTPWIDPHSHAACLFRRNVLTPQTQYGGEVA
jgi:hypothetical protein